MSGCNNNQQNRSECRVFPLASNLNNNILCTELVLDEVYYIQKRILDAYRNCNRTLLIDSGTPITEPNSIQSVIVDNGGSGYFSVPPTAQITHPIGSGAILEPIVNNGAIVGFNIIAAGSGYNVITAQADATLAGNGDAVIYLNVDNGVIDQAFIISPGSGYVVGDQINVLHPYGSGAIIVVSQVTSGGSILALNISSGGSGYEPIEPTLTVSHPFGSGFVGVPVFSSGALVNVIIQNPGVGYSILTPTVDINSITGAGASFNINVDSVGTITSIDVVNGGAGYTSSDTVNILPAPGTSGAGAVVSLVVNNLFPNVNPVDFYLAYTNEVSDTTKTEIINLVVGYFLCLGYNIEVVINPNTNRTLAWKINW